MNHIDASVMHEEMFRTIAEWKARAERAEALLREAQTEMDAGGYWASQVWRAKVRALLEGKT